MAKQISIIPFTGNPGHFIGYKRNGQYFLRCMPESVRQTAATRRTSRRFGIASRKGAFIRHAIKMAHRAADNTWPPILLRWRCQKCPNMLINVPIPGGRYCLATLPIHTHVHLLFNWNKAILPPGDVLMNTSLIPASHK